MSRWLPLLALSLMIPDLTLLSAAQAQTAAQTATAQKLVVLPFKNLSRQAEDDWLGESFSESLTVALGQSRQLELVERGQLDMVMREQGLGQSAFADDAQAPRLGKLIGARRMLLGSYQKQGSRLLVNVRLVDVETGSILSGNTVQLEGDYERLFSLQSRLASQLLTRLGQSAPALSELEQRLKITDTTSGAEKYNKGVLLARQMTDLHVRQAIELFEAVIAEDPECSLGHVALSEALSTRAAAPLYYPSRRADDLNRALEEAEKALKLKQHPEAVYRALAKAYFARGQYPQALEAIRESLRQAPGNTDSILVWLDLQAYVDSDLEQMRDELERFRADTSDPWVQFAIAMMYLKHHKRHGISDFSDVRALLLDVRRQLPQHAFVLIKLAYVEVLRGRYDLALEQLEQALRLEPQNYVLHYKAGFLMMGSPAHAAFAETALKKSLALLPEYGTAELHLGTLYAQRNRLEEARTQLLAARRHMPESAAVPLQLALLAERQGQDSQAYAYLLQALENSGKLMGEMLERGRIRLQLARMAQKLGQPAEAETHARAALDETDILPGEAYRQLIALAGEDHARAMQLFQELQQRPGVQLTEADQRLYQRIYLRQQLQARPNDASLLNDLGSLALVEGQLGDAESYFQLALKASPNQAAILFNLGLLRLQQQRPAEAITALRQVVAQDPRHRKAAFNLGRALLASGDKAAARTVWEGMLKQFPGDGDALRALEEL